jgi:hypothetical protein
MKKSSEARGGVDSVLRKGHVRDDMWLNLPGRIRQRTGCPGRCASTAALSCLVCPFVCLFVCPFVRASIL